MEQYELPDGWVWATLGEVTKPTSQMNPADMPDRVFKYVDISSIDSRRNEIATHKEVLGSEAPSRARKPIEAGDILFSTVRTYLRNVAVVPPKYDGEIASTGFCVLRTHEEIDPRFVFYHLLTESFIQKISEKQRGISYPAVTDRDVYAEVVPLAPSAEQLRIVEKIEALFEQSRTAREALDAIPALLRRFRQAVLAAAFRGELSTRDPDDEPASALLERILEERRRRWEENLRAKGKDPRRYTYPEPAPPDTRGLPELPEGWCWATVEQLGAIDEQAVLTGPFGSNLSRDDFVDTGVPVLTIGCLTEQGIMLDKAFYVSEEKAVELARYRVQQNDILFSRMASVGRADMVPGDIEGSIINYHLMRLRLHRSAIDPKFFVFYVRGSTNVTDYLRKINHGITRDGINTQQLLKLPVALAPKAEQRAIVSRVQSLFAQADIVEVAAELARRRLDRLDQSILARAFRGELVPQDPNDEPASVLLERIRAEKARRAGERTSRRRNKGRK